MGQPQVYTVREVAEITKLSRNTIHTLIHRGRFPGSYKSGAGAKNSPTRIPARAVDHYLNTRPLADK